MSGTGEQDSSSAGLTVNTEAPAPARTGWRTLTVDVTPLRRHRQFRLLLISRGVSFLGSMITYVAIPVQVYQLTHSSLDVGLVGLVEFVCLLTMAMLGGALADAVDRRLLVIGTEALLGLSTAALAVNAGLSRPLLWPIFVLAGVMAFLDALQRPALDALIPRLVEPHELTSASAIDSFQGTAGQIAGPALAGLLLASGGLVATYVADVFTFVVSLAVLALMAAVPPPPDAARPSLGRIVEGLRYARSRPELIGTYTVDVLATFFAMPSALFPAIAARFGGAGVAGLLFAAPAIGAFFASATSGWTTRVHRHGRAILCAAALWGAAIVAFGMAPTLWLAVAGLIVAGAADMVSGIFRTAMWNRLVPDSLRGRLASVELVSYTTGPLLGNVEAGIAASAFGLEASVVLGGGLCVAAMACCAGLLRKLRSYDDRLEPPAVTGPPVAEAVRDPIGSTELPALTPHL